MKLQIVLAACWTLLIGSSIVPNRVLAQNEILYAALHDENNLALVDVVQGKIIQRIQVGRDPDMIVLNADNTRLYVSNTGEITVSIVSLAGRNVTQVLRLPVNRRGIYAGPMTRTPDGSKIYVAERGENNEDLRIYVIDGMKELIVAQFEAGKNINSLTVSSDGRKLFVVNKGEGISVFDMETNQKIGSVEPLKGIAGDVTFCTCSPTGAYAYASYGPKNKVQIINTDTYKTEGEISMPKYKTGNQKDITFSPDGKYAYIITSKTNLKEVDGINVIETAKKEVVKIFNAGVVNRGMTCTADSKIFYCAADLLKWYKMLTLEHLQSISLRTTINGIAVVKQ